MENKLDSVVTSVINQFIERSAKGKEKYGVEWILQDQSKKELAMIKKYGVKNIQQSLEIKLKTSVTRRSLFYDSLLVYLNNFYLLNNPKYYPTS